jgi:hypothetical protein
MLSSQQGLTPTGSRNRSERSAMHCHRNYHYQTHTINQGQCLAAPRVGEQLEVQDPLEGPEQDSGQVAFSFYYLALCVHHLIEA